eukprot:scpid20216/ scgid9794/ 
MLHTTTGVVVGVVVAAAVLAGVLCGSWVDDAGNADDDTGALVVGGGGGGDGPYQPVLEAHRQHRQIWARATTNWIHRDGHGARGSNTANYCTPSPHGNTTPHTHTRTYSRTCVRTNRAVLLNCIHVSRPYHADIAWQQGDAVGRCASKQALWRMPALLK